MGKRVYTDAHAAVRFFAPTLDPLDVTLALRLPADHTHRCGEPRLVRRGRTGEVHEYAPYPAGSWSMSSKQWVNSPRLHVHLAWLLDQLEPKADAVAKLIQDGANVDFFCYSSGYTRLHPAIPRAIRERARRLGIVIEIDHYPMREDDRELTIGE
ncbi:MAG: DUF4279 domain-containing protein [Anaerolineae bacterium]|nr:DUF4279 domain-containing protein [Phycisphaerae bacterium]